MFVGQHALGRLLRHQEAAEGADDEPLLHLGWIEFDKRTAGAIARVVDDTLGAPNAPSTSAKSLTTSAGFVASQAKALPPISLASAANSFRRGVPPAQPSCPLS